MVALGEGLVVPFRFSAPLPPLRGTLPRGFRLRLRLRPDKPHAGEGRDKARGRAGETCRRGEGFFSAPLPPFGHPPPRLRTQERDEPGEGAGWVRAMGGARASSVPPSRPSGTLPRGFARGRGTGQGKGACWRDMPAGRGLLQCPPPALRAPSPAASHAGEGRTGQGAGKRDNWVGEDEVLQCPPPALRAPSPAASGFAFGYALTSRTQERDGTRQGAGWARAAAGLSGGWRWRRSRWGGGPPTRACGPRPGRCGGVNGR